MDTFNIEFDFEIQAHISYVGNHNKDIKITIKHFWNLYVVFKLLHCTVQSAGNIVLFYIKVHTSTDFMSPVL